MSLIQCQVMVWLTCETDSLIPIKILLHEVFSECKLYNKVVRRFDREELLYGNKKARTEKEHIAKMVKMSNVNITSVLTLI